MDKEIRISLAPAVIARLVGFLGLWFVLVGPDPAALLVGLFTAALATWTSLRLLPPSGGRPRFAFLTILAMRFGWQSVAAGIDVAWRALDPRLPLRPGFVVYPIRLQPSPTRNAFLTLSSLLPGTLPTGLNEGGVLLIHCLDVGQPVVAQMAAEELLLLRALGKGGNDDKS
ncbi:MAG: Na+/H+ antiporter subunit E [Chthoniobacterales bacterium]